MRTLEAGLLPQKAEYQGEMQVRNDLGVSFDQPDGISYLDAPLSVFRTPTDDGGVRFDITINHPPLGDTELYGLLTEVAPYKGFGNFPDGVIDDWRVIERAQGSGSRSKESQRLSEVVHPKLGDSWDEFLKSRIAFLDVLEDSSGPRFSDIEDVPFEAMAGYSTRQHVEHHFTQLGAISLDTAIEQLELAGVENAKRIVLSSLNRTIYRKKTKMPVLDEPHIPELYRRFESWSPNRRQQAINSVLGNLSGQVRMKLYIHMMQRYETIVLDNGKVGAYPKDLLEERRTLADAFGQRYSIRSGSHAAEFIDLPKRDGTPGRVLIPSTQKRIASPPTIEPAITWEQDKAGNRSFIFEREASRGLPTAYRDGVLGLLAIAYFSPDIRSEWREYHPIGNKTQFMGAAQVPVLALMRRAQLLKSDFFEAAESATSKI